MQCTIKGTIARLGNEQKISEKFTKREVLIEEADTKYPRQLMVEFVNKDIEKLEGFRVGQEIECAFSVQSRPSKDGTRFFTSARGFDIKTSGVNGGYSAATKKDAPAGHLEITMDDTMDTLPF